MKKLTVILVFLLVNKIYGFSLKDMIKKLKKNDDVHIPQHDHTTPKDYHNIETKLNHFLDEEFDNSFWIDGAQKKLREQLRKKTNRKIAKNVVFFMGDGMSLATVTAARIYSAQKLKQTGEENSISFEEFPYTGFSKTYCVDKQTADSACSATAYLTGVKGRYSTIGVNAHVNLNNCSASLEKANQVDSIMQWAQDAFKSTGIVTTTRITHASPSGCYGM